MSTNLHGVAGEQEPEPAAAHCERDEASDGLPGEDGVEGVEVGRLARGVPDHQVHEPREAEAEEGQEVLGLPALLALRLPDRVENLVLVDVTGVLVVMVVGQLPGVVRHQDEPVEKISNLRTRIRAR